MYTPADQHSVKDDSKTPHVGGPARVPRMTPQDLRTDVGRTAALIRQSVVVLVIQQHGVL